LYLGLDLGTSELKALLLADDHRIVGVARAALTVERPQPLWSEQAPQQWWHALEEVMRALGKSHPEELAAVRAIGLSGQMHGATLLDETGEVLRPAILWNDGRSGAQCEALSRAVPRLGEIAGNLAMPGFTAPKLLWVREHEPEIFDRVARVLLPKDWLRFMLSGEAVSEMSDATWGRATGPTSCSRPPGSRVRTCRGWSRAARCRRGSSPSWRHAGACATT